MNEQHPKYVYEGPISYADIEVLPEIVGLPWDGNGGIPLALIHGLRPSCIRIIGNSEKTDAILWRVNVYVDERLIIKRVTQEVEVALKGTGLDNGYALLCELDRRKEALRR